MKKLVILFLTVACQYMAIAQNAASLYETARGFMLKGDYNNAILVLNRAVLAKPGDMEITKDLALNYFFAKDYKKALDVINPLLDNEKADDQCFQIAGDINQALEDTKEAEKVYKKGLKKFPASGPLYNEFGILLWAQKDFSAIKQWEKGIEMDPSFSKNYFNASRFYFFSMEKVWGLLYGEIFLNMEPQGPYAPEIKDMVLQGYKKLFADANLEKNNKEKNSFVSAFLKTMNNQSSIAARGITTETLTMIRTRFIVDWFTDYAEKFPLRLFDIQRQYIQEGLFDAYNHWLFTSAMDLPAYQTWANNHLTETNELNNFFKSRILKIPQGQYYH